MDDLQTHLQELMAAPGISGREEGVREALEGAWAPLVDEIQVSPPGSLHAVKHGAGSEPRSKVMMTAHMDAIGMVANGEREGLLKLAASGYFDPQILPGQQVTVHGRSPLPGVIVLPPDHLLPAAVRNGVIPAQHLMVDTGLAAEELAKTVRIGDAITFASPPVRLGEDELAGPALDNRASLAALTACLQILGKRRPAWDLWLAATVQEEQALIGAPTSTNAIQPDLALVVDVTYAHDGSSPRHATYAQGAGPTLSWGPGNHPVLFQDLQALAGQLDIPCQVEIIPAASGTDVDAVQLAAGGVPTLLLGLPIRYMHTPVEVVRLQDVHTTGRLLAAFLDWLPEDYAGRLLSWDD